ncbi:hypothetical protein KP509_20G045900 [Ceratopteris richardii]|uniref:Uncharacterized protein n=1 Tax=Ceratopteris richardii TaxID=49495 RepID=A0A8T2SI84_CERRI|nr:hypothetical protein KP509_20G045900 [Ceratopteris richardii]
MDQGPRGMARSTAVASASAAATCSSTTGATQVVTPQQVLESLMMDGTFDDLRLKIINQLKHNEELKKYTTSMVEKSQTLNTPGAEQKSKRELFVSLKNELEGPVLDRASKAAWELILSKEGIGKEIMETVYRAYNQLHGKQTSQYSPSDPHTSVAAMNEQFMQGHGMGHLSGIGQDANQLTQSVSKYEE